MKGRGTAAGTGVPEKPAFGFLGWFGGGGGIVRGISHDCAILRDAQGRVPYGAGAQCAPLQPLKLRDAQGRVPYGAGAQCAPLRPSPNHYISLSCENVMNKLSLRNLIRNHYISLSRESVMNAGSAGYHRLTSFTFRLK